MIDVSTRALLRQRALAAWERSKGLPTDTETLHREIRETKKPVQERHVRRAADRHAHHRDHLADWEIRRSRRTSAAPDASTGGIGLAASIKLPRLVLMEKAMRTWIPFLVRASDVGSALGLAIAMQPDFAVIDDRLAIGTGAELMRTFPTYAPETRALFLTDDEGAAQDIRFAGFDVLARDLSENDLSAWIASVAS